MTVSYYDTWCDWLLPKHSYHCHIWFTSVNPAYSKPATQLEPYQLKYSSLQRVCVSDKRRSSQLHTQVDSHFVVTVWLTVRSDCSSRVIELNDWLVVWQSSLGGGGGGALDHWSGAHWTEHFECFCSLCSTSTQTHGHCKHSTSHPGQSNIIHIFIVNILWCVNVNPPTNTCIQWMLEGTFSAQRREEVQFVAARFLWPTDDKFWSEMTLLYWGAISVTKQLLYVMCSVQ